MLGYLFAPKQFREALCTRLCILRMNNVECLGRGDIPEPAVLHSEAKEISKESFSNLSGDLRDDLGRKKCRHSSYTLTSHCPRPYSREKRGALS